MKIAIVCYPTFGGSGVVATELGLELARRGHEIHFITYRQPVRMAGNETVGIQEHLPHGNEHSGLITPNEQAAYK